MAVWTAHRRDQSKEGTQHCTGRLKQNTKERDLRAGKWTDLREGGVSPKERNSERTHEAQGETQQATETRKICFFPF